MSKRGSDKALAEFLSEAQEIVDGLNANLLEMDQQRAAGDVVDPDLINEAFRAVHSLKGLSGLFGLTQMSDASHALESLLDDLRLGKVQLSPAVLDLLFEAVELFGAMIVATSSGEELPAERLSGYLARLASGDGPSAQKVEPRDALSDYDFPPNILSVLTEYEEHRLLENIRQGRTIYQLQASFDLMSIDTGLESLKEKVKPIGEVITYLPSADSIDDTQIQLDVLVGAKGGLKALQRAFANEAVQVSQIARSSDAEPTPEPAPSPAVELPPPVAAQEPPAPTPAPRAKPRDTPGVDRATAAPESLRSVSQTVRVDIRKLDALMNAVSELTIAHAGLSTIADSLAERVDLVDEVRAMTRELRSLERRIDELQGGILEVRMVPLRQVFDKLTRVVRKISRESAKEIRLEIAGADTELDKLIVEELSDPLMHIIRNAIDHGIEPPHERKAAGKPEIGTIRVAARQQGSRVVVTVSDDGRGIDEERVGQVAVERGLVDEAAMADMSRREMLNLLFLPGMSTREQATELSGRGVGLDVVKTNIAHLSGIIDVQSQPGQGTELVITLPITLAIIQALVIKAAGRTYAVPLNSVMESLVIEPHELRTVEGREVTSLRNQTLVLVRLERLFRLERPASAPAPEKVYCVVMGLAQHRLGLIVDDLVGERDIVIKPLGKTLSQVPGVAGATELGQQRTVLVLDVPGMIEEALGGAGGGAEAA